MRYRFWILLLPLVLLLAAGWGLGCYYETNDDLTIVALLRGITAAAPVSDLHLYFHGYAALWSRLYAAFPVVPWYGLTLYGLLYAATVLGAAVLWRLLNGAARPRLALAFMVLFWLVAWLEHGFWFNYARVPVLLAGTGVLFAAQRAPARRALALGLLAFGLSWLIRPSMALFGAGVVLPGAWWLAGRRAVPLLAGVALWAVLGAVGLQLAWSPTAATFRRLDVLKSNLNDFLLTAPPTTALSPPDSLALAAARHWLLADSTLINEPTLRRIAPIRAGYFLTQTAPGKLRALAHQLPRDYFPLLLLLAATAGLVAVHPRPGRRGFWVVQVGYVLLVLGLGVLLKLPPRLALPLLDCWVLSNLLFLRQAGPPPARSLAALLAVLVLAAVPYTYKTVHRRTVLAREQAQNRAARHHLRHLTEQQLPAGGIVVSDALEETYKAESPFEPVLWPGGTGAAAPLRWLTVRGWQTLHPSQPALRRQLTGTRDFTQALRVLGRRAATAWLLTPATATLLNRQLALRPPIVGPVQALVPLRVPADSLAADEVQLYQMRVKFVQKPEKAKIL